MIKRAQTNIDLLMHKSGVLNDKGLSKDLGISQANLSQKLRGSISINTLELLALYFNVSIKDLLR
jgi:transcriptional regulator with XRE-family HTH domain